MGDVDCDYVRDGAVNWLNEVLETLECEAVGQLSLAKCKAPKKDVLASWLNDALNLISEQNDLIKKLSDGTGVLKTELIGSQQKVIDLQGELLGSKTEQLTALQTAVKSSVEDTMKAGLCSYSASVQSAVQTELRSSWSEVVAKSSGQAITTETKLKEAVKSAVAEEDKSKNVMIFGKNEVPNEDVAATVAEIMQDMNEKPRVVECIRVGTFQVGKPRPIKVKLCSADAVSSILRGAKHLKNSGSNKNTFIAPDRTQEERAAHKKLVEKLKEMMNEDPGKYHYIRRGAIRSVQKSADHTNKP